MDPENLLSNLRARGMTVAADGNRLLVSPRDQLTNMDRQLICQHKSELLSLLAAPLPPSPDEWRDLFEERAGIMEFDGNLPRARAETLALAEVLAEFWKAAG